MKYVQFLNGEKVQNIKGFQKPPQWIGIPCSWMENVKVIRISVK